MTSSSGVSFSETLDRLDQIVETVRSKDTSLEHSLDLLEEAIGLGLGAVELVDVAAADPGEEPTA